MHFHAFGHLDLEMDRSSITGTHSKPYSALSSSESAAKLLLLIDTQVALLKFEVVEILLLCQNFEQQVDRLLASIEPCMFIITSFIVETAGEINLLQCHLLRIADGPQEIVALLRARISIFNDKIDQAMASHANLPSHLEHG